MSHRRLRHLMRLFRVFERLPGMFVPGLMFLLAMFFTGAVGMRCKVVQLRGPLMVFVMGSVVISRGHN